jgi:hypothetical protein
MGPGCQLTCSPFGMGRLQCLPSLRHRGMESDTLEMARDQASRDGNDRRPISQLQSAWRLKRLADKRETGLTHAGLDLHRSALWRIGRRCFRLVRSLLSFIFPPGYLLQSLSSCRSSAPATAKRSSTSPSHARLYTESDLDPLLIFLFVPLAESSRWLSCMQSSRNGMLRPRRRTALKRVLTCALENMQVKQEHHPH